jgi:hypothetical protein
MHVLNSRVNRRFVLRGMLGGAAVTVALPFLDYFLDGNGTALADGTPIPVRFGTWLWCLGMDEAKFIPTTVGADYDLPPQIESWKPVKQHINVFTKFNVPTDGKPSLCHYTGWVALRSGVAPASRNNLTDPSIDVLIADSIGGATRFRTLDAAATGSVRDSFSFRNSDAMNAPVTSVVELYQKVFGSEFQDPNSRDFKPRPELMVRESVLSGVTDQSVGLQKRLGAADRAKLDRYFTSVRELEQRLELQMQKPPPALSCKIPAEPKEVAPGTDTDVVAVRHKLMTDIMAMAVACNQTRVFNMVYSGQSGLTKKGLDKTHHTVTHEEILDPQLGYQPTSFWFITQAMESFAYFVGALAAIPEGAGTLLDNLVVYAHSDHDLAKTHSMRGIPIMTAGRAGGRLKTGLHVDGKGDVGSRVGFTLMKAMGLTDSEWGKESLKTSREVSEIVV